MPTYEYTCRDCGHTFEIVQSMLDETLTMCPECGGSLRKVFAPPAISFRGSGFYATDHGKKAKKHAEATGTGEKRGTGEKSGDGSGDTSTETRKSSDRKDASTASSEKSSKPSKKEPAAS